MANHPVQRTGQAAVREQRPNLRAAFFLLVAALASASMWFYVNRILVPYQRLDAVEHARPRGNLSDLYPRWLGARELLLHRRNPYSDDITLEIQKGYYGRTLDPAKPNDPKDQEGFAYPVYVVFLLAPLIGLPFYAVQIFFRWVLIGVTVASIALWLKVLRWRLSTSGFAAAVLLMLGCFPTVQGIKLQQLTLLVAALLAAVIACVSSGFLLAGGGLLALATIKPQLAAPLVVWLLLWAGSDWRIRRNLVFGFGAVMAVVLVASEIVLPGWLHMFAEAIPKYHQYTQNQSVLDELLNGTFGRFGGFTASCAAALLSFSCLWKLRREPAVSQAFGAASALVIALTVLVVPMSSPYNQVLLLPAALILVRDRVTFGSRSRSRRMMSAVGGLLVGWQWAACFGLIAIYFLVSRSRALEGSRWPFLTTFVVPVWVFGLTLLLVKDRVVK